MASYEEASRTKDAYEKELFESHPHIVSIAPQLILEDGRPTSNAHIVIGIDPALKELNLVDIPQQLQLVNIEDERTDSLVPVAIVEEGVIRPEAWADRERPCPGGYSVGHYRITAGTIGLHVQVDGNYGYILSNNHVLANANDANVGDAILQPGPADGGTQADDTIGTLDRWVPLDKSGATDNEVDCALALVAAGWNDNLTQYVHHIGTPRGTGTATVGQRIRKASRTTGLKSGDILSDNASIQAAGLGRFTNQLKYDPITKPGDSGATIWDDNSLTVLGLHSSTSNTAGYGNKIDIVFQQLGADSNFITPAGNNVAFPPVTIEI
ncbi:MAG: hypothetical protein ACR2NP_10190 [Pirellulaceae bacterium]